MTPVGSWGVSFGGVTPRREGLEASPEGAGTVFGGVTTVALVGMAGLGADGTGWAGADGGGAAGALGAAGIVQRRLWSRLEDGGLNGGFGVSARDIKCRINSVAPWMR